jgi:hypothetical protein
MPDVRSFELLARPGDDPLSHPLEGSTLGAARFHGRVRNGVGWFPRAVITRSSQESEAIKPFGLILDPPPTPCQPPRGGGWQGVAGGVSHDPANAGSIAKSREAFWAWVPPVSGQPPKAVGRGWAAGSGATPPWGRPQDPFGVGYRPAACSSPPRARGWVRTKHVERLGPLGCTGCPASTCGLSTWWSTTALERDLVLRRVSRLDALSGYPDRT